MKIIWLPSAEEDLQEITAYIAADNPAAANRLFDRIVERVELLSLHPRSGRIVPEIGRSAVREVIVGNYRIIYRTQESTLEVVAVREGHRLLPPDMVSESAVVYGVASQAV